MNEPRRYNDGPREPRRHNWRIQAALDELVDARRAFINARHGLSEKWVSAVVRANKEGAHDRAALRVTAAILALNRAIDAEVGP